MNEPCKRMTYWRFYNEKSVVHCGAKEKRREANMFLLRGDFPLS